MINVTREDIRNMIREGLIRSLSYKYVDDGMEKLGFGRDLHANDYEGKPRWNIRHFKIPAEKYDEGVEKKVSQLLNRCGWRIFKRNEGNDFYGNGPFVFLDVESVRGSEADGNWVFYHATPAKNVPKILKNGLCPRDEGKRGEFRGDRIYLSLDNDRWLFNNLFDRDTDYEVFKVDLRGSGIKLYRDEYASGGFYTLENIPPERLTLTDNPQREVNRKREEFFDLVRKKVCSPYGFELKSAQFGGKTLDGEINGVSFRFTFNLFGGVTYTGKPYEINMERISSRAFRDRQGFNTPEDAVKWIVGQINKALKKK